jgi:nicotinamide mononucleotide transporter
MNYYQYIFELVGFALGVLVTVLQIKQHRFSWHTNIVYSSLFLYTCIKLKFYVSAAVYIYYIGTSIVGVLNQKNEDSGELHITAESKKNIKRTIFIAVVLNVALYFLMKNYTDASSPFLDSFVACVKIVSTFFTLRKKIGAWLLMSIGDAITTLMYFLTGYYISAFMFLVFAVMDFNGFLIWLKHYRRTKERRKHA